MAQFVRLTKSSTSGAYRGPLNRAASIVLATTAVLIFAALDPLPATAQEGWPFSEWDDDKSSSASPGKAYPGASQPGQQSPQVLRQMDEPPRFSDSAGSFGNGRPGTGADWQGNGRGQGRTAPPFATPPAVERTNLAPLEPLGDVPRTSVSPQPSGPPSLGEPRARTSNWAPVTGAPGSAAPVSGQLDAGVAAPMLAAIEKSPRSRVLRRLLSDVLEAMPDDVSDGASGQTKLEALFRLGYLDLAAQIRLPDKAGAGGGKWAEMALARSIAQAGTGRSAEACEDARDIVAAADRLPQKAKDQAILLSGFCGAIAKNDAAVQLASDVARERSGFDRAGLAGLTGLAVGSKPRIAPGTVLRPLSYRVLQLARASDEELVNADAQAAVLPAMAVDKALSPEARIVAAEKAAAAHLISADVLAQAYRSAPAGSDIETMQSGGESGRIEPSQHRAKLFNSAVRQQTPLRKVRLIRAFLDASRQSQLFSTGLELMAQPVLSLQAVPEIGWFAETAIEVLLYAGHYERARDWLRLADTSDPRGPGALAHWSALLDIAGAGGQARRGDSLTSLEPMANRGDFRAAELHRLATVLDALDYHVPIPLWEAASRTPQPTDGHLPATGLLPQLQQAAKSGEPALVKLLVLSAIGPDGPRGAHMISLGDSIRALKRVGLERDARLIGLEALFAAWPRAPQG